MARTKAFDPTKALNRALETFWQHGYEATSMEMLVSATGLSRSSLYNTFGDKQALYSKALSQYFKQASAENAQLEAKQPTVISKLQARFDALVYPVYENGRRGCFVVNTAVELAPHNAQVAETVRESFDGSIQGFEMMLQSGIESGEFSAELNPQSMARFLFNTYCGLQVQTKAGQPESVLSDIANTTLDMLRAYKQ